MTARSPASPLPRPADRDGARRRRQGQPPAGRRSVRAAAARRPLAGDRSATPRTSTSAAARLAITTDSFVVTPLRFPGGSIGELAVNGTVNDLAVSGARPLALVVTLRARGRAPDRACSRPRCARWRDAARRGRRARSSAATPRSSSTARPTGCTSRPPASGGRSPASRSTPRSVRPGRPGPAVRADRRPRHHDPAGARRARPRGRPPLRHALGAAAGRGAGRRGRRRRPLDARPDARRRRHLAQRAGARLRPRRRTCSRKPIPVRDEVRGACELLGLDPLHIANEGQFLAVVAPEHAERGAGGAARGARRRARRAIIGEVRERAGAARCWRRPRYGGSRVVDMLVGDPLPRIC